jgi:outer membrane protein assembly factor BamB
MKRILASAALWGLLSLSLAGTVPLTAEEWTRFRGPNGSGVSEAKDIPVEWSEEDYLWKVELPGPGHSQPVIWGEKVFVTSAAADGSARVVSSFGVKDGRRLWEKRYPAEPYPTHQYNNLAASTPVVDGERLYVVFAHPGEVFLAALEHSGAEPGKEAWKVTAGKFAARHGFGASPILFEDTVVVTLDSESGPEEDIASQVVAFEKATGKERWRTPRRRVSAAYGTPCVLEHVKGKPELLLTSEAHGISSLDARSGAPLWEAVVFDKRSCSSPVVGAGLVFGTCGSGGGGNFVVAVRPGGKGDVTATHKVYEVRQSAPYVPSLIAKGDRLYLWHDKGGVVSSLDAASGKVHWRGRADGNYFGSPVWVDGKIYCIAAEGEVVVVGTGDAFEILARNPLGGVSHSTPAVAGGRMLLRTVTHLMAVGGDGGEAPAGAGTRAGAGTGTKAGTGTGAGSGGEG